MNRLYALLSSLGEGPAIKATRFLTRSEQISVLLKKIRQQKLEGKHADSRETAKFLREPWRTVILRELFNIPGINVYPNRLLEIAEEQIEKGECVKALLTADFLPEELRLEIGKKLLEKQIAGNCFVSNINHTVDFILNS